MKKVICTVINDLTYDQRMHRICNSLAEAGYDVELVGRSLPGSLPLQKRKFNQKRIKCWFNKGKLFYLEYNIRLFFYLLGQPFDGVCSVDLDTLIAGYFASKIKKKTCLYDAHEYFQEVPEVVNRPATRKIWETIARFIIPKLKYCYTVSPGLAELFSDKYKTIFHTILNVPERSPDPVTKADYIPVTGNKILLYQGALNEGRGLEAAIKAMEKLDGIEFWLAGEGDLSEKLRKMTHNSGLDGKVKFHGYVLPDELKQLTPQAFLGYNLLENKGLSYFHSLANKFFDYMHAGIPTLNPDFPEYRTINDRFKVGYLVESLSPESVYEVILAAISNQAHYELLRRNCQEAALVYNWEVEKEKLLTIYKTALQ